MTVIGEAFIEVSPDTKSFEADLDKGTTSAFAGLAKKAAVAAGAFLAFDQAKNFMIGAVNAASDLDESMSKVNVVFGDSAAQVLAFAEGAAEGLGQTQAQALEATGTFGNLLRAVGLTEAQSAEFSTTMVGLASDLASFNNADPTEVLEALRAGLVGEAEPLKRFGININQARIEAKALELGLVGVDGELTQVAKTQATYALIMEDTALAQGDFARTSGGLANQQRILSARFGDLQARIGTAFLPIVTKVVTFLAGPAIDAFDAVAGVVGRVASSVAQFLAPAFALIRDLVGQFVLAFQNAGPGVQSEASGIIGIVETIGLRVGDVFRFLSETVLPAVQGAFSEVAGGVRALVLAFQAGGSDVTSSGLAGMLERVGLLARQVWDVLTGTAIPGIRQAVGSLISGFQGTGGEGSFFVDLGEAARKMYDVVRAVLPRVAEFWSGTLQPALEDLAGFVRSNLRPILIGVAVAVGLLVAPVLTAAAAFVALYQQSETFRGIVAGVVDVVKLVAETIGRVLGPVIEFLGGQLGELAVFFRDNWQQMYEAVRNVVIAIAAVIAVVIAPIVIFFRSWGDELLAIIMIVWDQIKNIISTAVNLIKGIITLVMALLTGEWGQAWNALLGIVGTVFGYIVGTIKNAVALLLQLIQGALGGLADLWSTGWQTLFNVLESFAGSIAGRVSGFVGEIIGYFAGIPGQLLGLVGQFVSAAASLGSALIDGLGNALKGAVGFAGDIARAIKTAINNVVLKPLREALTFEIDLPGPFGSFSVNGGRFIPLLAAGGITTGPVLAGLGEAGREAVLPLPPGLLEGLVALARDRLSGQAPAPSAAPFVLQMVFPGVTSRSEANAVTRAVNDNLASSEVVRRLQLGARA